MQFQNVTADSKANIYFDGKVVSHTIITQEGEKKTLGVILAGEFHFNTEAPELMQIVGGGCEVTLDGESESNSYANGTSFKVSGNSGFTIVVNSTCEYVCSFLA